jgi:hypothetical protein
MLGYIYLATYKRPHEEAIMAYFDNAGREVSVILCPDFEAFMVDNHLSNRDIIFITDLLPHRPGRRLHPSGQQTR